MSPSAISLFLSSFEGVEVCVQHEDRYGSPSLEEIEAFSRRFYGELVTSLGEEAAGIITVEVSSPVCFCLPPDSEGVAQRP